MNFDLDSLKARVSRLSVMIFDIDGTLTDGRIFWVPNSGWTQMYSVRDGMGIKRLQEVGIEVAANLRKQVPELLKQHNAKSVEFKVVIKDGKATLKAVPK